MQEIIIGFALLLTGAICGGSFGLPSKYVKKDTPWEVLWGPFFFFVTLVIPLIVAPSVVNNLGGIYETVGAKTLTHVFVFGMLWGLGSMALGMSFAFIGLSLAYALNYGAQIIFGSLVPLFMKVSSDPGAVPTTTINIIGVGLFFCLLGVIVSGRAGILKERDAKTDEDKITEDDSKKPRMFIGLIIAVVSGLLCACYAVAFAFAGPIGEEAVKMGNEKWAAAWATTAMILWGGAVTSCLYCTFQLTKNKTWGHLTKAGIGHTLKLAFLMALLHNAAIFFFGIAAIKMGSLGVSVGYAVFMSFAIITGNVHGFRSGEWKGANKKSINRIVAGIILLIIGICVLGYSRSLQG